MIMYNRFAAALATAIAVVQAQNASSAPSSSPCCEGLQNALPGKVFTPQMLQYTQIPTTYWTSREREIRPACFVKPANAQEVSTVIRFLNRKEFQTVDSCKFAIRSGGHLTWGGAANQPGGVTIDLTEMKEITISKDRKVVSIGSGNRWLDVYDNIEPKGLAVSGGRWGHVGVGGLLTGGGLSFFQGTRGPSCDGVLNHELVLANGSVVNANATHNADLHRALKGGNNNLGIVTRFDMHSWEQGKIWGGSMTSIMTMNRAANYFTRVANSSTTDKHMMIMFSVVEIFGKVIVGGLATHQEAKPHPEIFRELREHELNQTSIWSLFTPDAAAKGGKVIRSINPLQWFKQTFGRDVPVGSYAPAEAAVESTTSSDVIRNQDTAPKANLDLEKRQTPGAASGGNFTAILPGANLTSVIPAGNASSIIPGWGTVGDFAGLGTIAQILDFGTMSMKSYRDIAYLNAIMTPNGEFARAHFATFSYHNSATYMKSFMKLYGDWQSKVTFFGGGGLIFQPLWTHSRKASYTAGGGNVLGLEDTPEDVIVVLVLVVWLDPRHDGAAQRWTKDFIEAAQNLAKQEGAYSPYIYANYGAEFQDVIGGYGNKSRDFLIQTAKKYDPDGLFQKRVPGGYKLTRTANDYCQFGC